MNRPRTDLIVCTLAFAALSASTSAQGRRALPEGVTPKIQATIDKGLAYLARQQNHDGSFGGATSYGSAHAAMTALSGMAFVGAGNTPTRGRYWRNVRKAARYLMEHQAADGLIAGPMEHRHMYGHGFGTMFLAQVYGMEPDARTQKRIHKVLTRAVRMTCRAQNSHGAWYYFADSTQEEGSITITQVQALRACRNAGIVVPKVVIDKAVAYIRKLANKDGGVAYSMRSRGSRPGITAAAVAVLFNAGKYDDKVAKRALDYAARHLPTNGSGNHHHYYCQLYLSQGLYQEGKKRWGEYYKKMSKWFLRQQRADGGWMGDGVGEVYGTAVALTILQLPHSLVPIYQR